MNIKKTLMWGLGIVIGAICGYLYWYFVGCTSGHCTITSSSLNSTAYGALLGGLLANTITPIQKNKAPVE